MYPTKLCLALLVAAWHSYGESATQGNGDHAPGASVSTPWLHPLGENDTAEDMLETMRRLNNELIAEYELGILAKYAGIGDGLWEEDPRGTNEKNPIRDHSRNSMTLSKAQFVLHP